MTLTVEVLGEPGRDNAAYVRADSGRELVRLLFDCGEGTAPQLGRAEAQAVDALLFSHLHMDHVAGFDSFFRMVYSRTSRPNVIYGPAGTAEIMQHRMRGFLWNLEDGDPAVWDVVDVLPDRLERARMRLGEAFAQRYAQPAQPRQGALVWQTASLSLEALQMDHRTASLAYVLRERPRLHVRAERLPELGLAPGPWLQRLKQPGEGEIVIGGRSFELASLRAELITMEQGQSFAYCTDFRLDAAALERLAPALAGCDTLVCECQYRADDAELAARNFHMTAPQVAELARRAGVADLILFHVSDRYRHEDLAGMLAEARAIFPAARFPAHWAIEP